MLNIPEYKEYGGETKIALMDNSSLAFMHELSQRSYPSDGILGVYDLILIAVRRSWGVWSGIPVHLQVFWQMSVIVVMYWRERPLHRTF